MQGAREGARTLNSELCQTVLLIYAFSATSQQKDNVLQHPQRSYSALFADVIGKYLQGVGHLYHSAKIKRWRVAIQ